MFFPNGDPNHQNDDVWRPGHDQRTDYIRTFVPFVGHFYYRIIIDSYEKATGYRYPHPAWKRMVRNWQFYDYQFLLVRRTLILPRRFSLVGFLRLEKYFQQGDVLYLIHHSRMHAERWAYLPIRLKEEGIYKTINQARRDRNRMWEIMAWAFMVHFPKYWQVILQVKSTF
jgi:hypothetical protein